MVVILAGAVLFGILLILSSSVPIPEEKRVHRLEVPFYKMAVWISSRYKRTKEEQEKETEKWKLALILLFLGCLCLPILDYATTKQEEAIEDFQLDRPEKGDGEISYHIQAKTEEESEQGEVLFTMKERYLTDAEKEEYLQNAREEIDRIVLGENSSADEVRGKIVLVNTLQEGRVTVQWIQEPQNLIDEQGNITQDLEESGEILILRALMNCEGMESTYEFALHLMPLIRSEEEEFAYELRKAVEEAQENSSQEKRMVLPRQINGKNISWTLPGSQMTGVCLVGILLLAILGYAGKEQEFRKAEQMRKRQLLLDYPDVVFKLGMLLNAGLTIQNAFFKIAEEYQNQKRSERRWAYEEMVYACNEMKSGISEAKSYERFGRRCGETCYVRLGTTLAGGLQKSAEGLTTLLLKEAEQAMEDRRLLARKLGEEAGTRLMFPMILMLLVVMVILMVPAMISF